VAVLTARGLELREFWETVRSMSREAFLADYPHPFLLELKAVDDPVDENSMDFATVVDLTASKLGRAGDGDERVCAESRVWGLKKFGTSTSNNDCVLTDGRVSKLHAWFLQDGEGGWVLCDAESSNGTFVNSVRLDSLGKSAVANRDQIGFGGQARFVYVTAGHFQRQARFLLRGELS
jgi:hypothetical protein